MEATVTHEPPTLAVHVELLALWKRLLGVPVESISENFFEVGGDSALVSRMLDETEKLTGRRIEPDTFLQEPTVRHLARCIIRALPEDDTFTCVQSGDGTPLFFFHGDILGGGFYSRRLAEHLGPDQPFYVSSPIDLRQADLPRLEQLATIKRAALKKRQPHGPYMLGGFCVGAVVAYEIARQLEREGEQVQVLFLIEPEIGNPLTRAHQKLVRLTARRHHLNTSEKLNHFERGVQKLERLRQVWSSPMREKKEFVVKNTRKLLTRNHSETPATDGAPQLDVVSTENREWLIPAYHWILNAYVPKRFRGPVTLLVTDETETQAPYIVNQWRKAAPQARVERIPREHLTCITTHLDAIAGQVKSHLEASRALMAMMLQALCWSGIAPAI
jgi:thioesterase domain-containing protein